MIDDRERLGHCFDAVSTKVFHKRCQFCIAAPFDESGYIALITQVVHQALPPHATSHESERRIILIGATIDPRLQVFASRFLKGLSLKRAVLDADGVPSKGVEDFLDPFK